MATGLYSPVTLTRHGTSAINVPNIRSQGFIPSGASSPGFQVADVFQSGPKVFTSASPNLVAQYGDEAIDVITPAGNLRLPSGGVNLGAGTFGFGTEVISTPTQADKGMRLAEKLTSGAYPTSATARRLLETGTNVNPNVLGGIANTGRLGARLLPGANVVLGGASAANRFAQGQPLRGIAALGSMIPGPIGYLGLGAETAMDVGANYFDDLVDFGVSFLGKGRREEDAEPVVKTKVNPLSRRVTRSVLPTEPQSRSQDSNRGGGPGVTIGAGGGQTRTVNPRSRAAMYSTPTRRSAPPPFRRFNNGGIVSLLGGF
tara:strand:- start:83 stop:1030 length:948 start_codon:yes stop_codon:yes gene_type:complete